MLNVVIFGAPGSGKGTQSELIIKKYGLSSISVGNILRKEIQNNTNLGIQAEKYISKGHLVPDELILDMFADTFDSSKNSKGFIFDGFPRTIVQGEFLDKMLRERNSEIDVVISLEVKEEELVKRLLNRAVISGRSDDNEEVIKSRFEVYEKQTAPLVQYYLNQGKLFTVKGEGSIDRIFEEISSVIDRF